MGRIRIELDRLTQNDTERLTQLANNKKIWDNLRDSMPYPYSKKDAEDFISTISEEEHPLTFAIRVDGQLCGVVGLVIQDDVYRNSAELGYWVGEEYWGMGIATEAVQLITNHGFKNLKLQRIQAGVYNFNESSMKVLLKNGFEKEGVFKKAVFKNGLFVDEHRFAKLST